MNITKKIVAIVTGLTLVVMMAPSLAQGLTTEELQAQIASLTAQLAALQAQLTGLQTGVPAAGVPAACSGISFTRNLKQGMSGTDVKCLQALLNQSADTQVAVSGAGSPGNETTYFGSKTKAAVSKYQLKNVAGIVGTGYVGPKTRAVLNAALVTPPPVACTTDADCPTGKVCSAGSCVTPAVGAAGLTVSLASDTPAATVIPDGSLYNPILKLTLIASGQDVVVTGITVTRGGYISNTYVEGVSVWDETGNRLGNIVTALTADGKAAVALGTDKLTIPNGQSKSLTVKANISASAGSGTINFSVNSASDITTEGTVTINGTFPIVSNTMSVVDGSTSLADVYIDDQSVAGTDGTTILTADGTLEVGNTEVEIAKFQFNQNNSKEAIKIEQVVVYVEGTINEEKDLKNWKLVAQDGTVLATAEKASDRYVTFNLATPYTIDKGVSRNISVKADVADGSTHYFAVHIQNDYDVLIKGVTTGANIKPLGASGAAFTDTYSSTTGYFKIKAGSLTVAKASASPSGNVAPADQNIVIAKFDLMAVGEKIEIRKMGIYVKVATTTSGHILTGTLKVQDASTNETYLSISADTSNLQGTSAISATTVGTNSYRDLSTYIVIESGKTKTINVIGSIPSTAASTDTYQAAIGKFYVKRYASNDYTTLLSASYYSANELTVGGVSLSVNKNASFTGKRAAAGTNNVQIGEFVLGASTADDIRVSTVKIICSTTTGVQNVYLTKGDGTQVGTTVGSPNSSGDTFSTNFTITKTTSEILKVYANITSAFTGSSIYASVGASGVTGYGVSSSKALETTPSAQVDSNTVTIGTATLTIKQNSSLAPKTAIILAGQSGVSLNAIQFDADFEDLILKAITLQMTSASSTLWNTTSSIPANIVKVYLYDGSTLLGSAYLAQGLASITGINVTLPNGTSKTLTVKADISGSGALTSVSVGGIQVYSTTTAYLGVYSSQGIMSTGITLTSNAASNNFLFTDAAPTVTNAYSDKTGAPASQEIVAKYTVLNSGARTLTLTDLVLTASLSGASNSTDTVTNFRLYDVNDTLLATSTGSLAGATTTSITFDIDGYGTTEEIAAGASKTYVIKANTLSAEAGETTPGQVFVKLSTEIGGSKGYSSTDVSGTEKYWSESNITYNYTPYGGSALTTLKACDSVTVYGATITY